jgi:hypothetical protein
MTAEIGPEVQQKQQRVLCAGNLGKIEITKPFVVFVVPLDQFLLSFIQTGLDTYQEK